MVLIESYGSIYKLADREYLNILHSISDGLGYRINPKRYQGEVVCNLSDLTVAEAKALVLSFDKDRAADKRLRTLSQTSRQTNIG